MSICFCDSQFDWRKKTEKLTMLKWVSSHGVHPPRAHPAFHVGAIGVKVHSESSWSRILTLEIFHLPREGNCRFDLLECPKSCLPSEKKGKNKERECKCTMFKAQSLDLCKWQGVSNLSEHLRPLFLEAGNLEFLLLGHALAVPWDALSLILDSTCLCHETRNDS